MSEKVCLHLLILCGIFSHLIVATFSDENIEESSNLLLRKKRVLNRESGGDIAVRIKDFQYVVQIKKVNRVHCVGSILSQHTVITAAVCIVSDVSDYKVTSGAIRTTISKIHNVTGKSTYYSRNVPRALSRDGVGLITVDPPFVYNRFTQNIDLYNGHLLPNTNGIIAGWGCLNGVDRGTRHIERLRAITVPIISNQECAHIYRYYANITDKEICTFHIDRNCGETDVGAALVINHALAGIHLWSGQIVNYNKPDVFLDLQHFEYYNWIRANIV